MTSPDIEKLTFDKVLSFNYTDIYMRLYDVNNLSGYDYIHGRAKLKNSIDNNDMVLGIDEYLLDDRKNKDVEFIAFKKYYQRIHKSTGCRYREWVDEIHSNKLIKNLEVATIDEKGIKTFQSKYSKYHNLYIFGHSLDVTDKDVLRDLILNDNVYTTILYNKIYDKDGQHDNGRKSLGEKITNLVKVIGQDELIRRTGGSTKTIEFKLQQDMIERGH